MFLRYEFAREVFRVGGVKVGVVPILSSEYPLPVARPTNGVLSTLGNTGLRRWREVLSD